MRVALHERPSIAPGLRRVVAFNLHWYAAALCTVATCGVVLLTTGSDLLRGCALAAAAGASWWTVSSLVGSYWIYDVARLNEWRWLEPHTRPATPGFAWLNVHAGFDTATAALRRLLPGEVGQELSIQPPGEATTPSLRRARELEGDRNSRRASPLCYPHGSESFDRVFFLQTAHELRRRAQRLALFREAHRVLRVGGTLTVCEQGRNLQNALLWGPGLFHQYPVREWRACGRLAGFTLEHESRRTPFVHLLVFRRTR